MQILVISDVHSNLEAFQAVLAEVGRVDMVFNLGDLVGYGADPNGVVELIKSLNVEIVSVLGNHDYAGTSGDVEGLNAYAAQAVLWTGRVLSEENKAFLRQAPLKRRLTVGGRNFYLVHGSPKKPLEEYVYPMTPQEVLRSYLRETRADILLMGHTHIPMRFDLKDPMGTLFNPGSIGQSRDGIPKSSYAIIYVEDDQLRLEPRRVDYDVDKPANKILKAGLPSLLAHRLYVGQ